MHGNLYYIWNASYHWQLFDSDTNGFLDVGSITSISEQTGYTHIVSANGTSGNDNNFTDRAKLRISSITVLDTAGRDTLRLFKIADADNDGSIYDSSKAINTFDLTAVSGVISRPPSISRRIDCRASIVKAVGKFIILRLSALTLYGDGAQEIFSLRGSRPDSTFIGGDSVRLALQKCSGPDTVRYSCVLILDGDIYNNDGHKLVSVSYSKSAPADTIVSLSVPVVFDQPVSRTTLYPSGSFTASALIRNGFVWSIQGSFTDSTITAVYKDENGTVHNVRWDKAGNVLTN